MFSGTELMSLINTLCLLPLSLLLRAVLVFLICILLRRLTLYTFNKKKNRVSVVVLGDVGRSPRMQYHALSLTKHDFKVDILGFSGSTPHSAILGNDNIQIFHVKEISVKHIPLPKTAAYFTKVFLQSWYLWYCLLWRMPPSQYILLQNPPCIPSMAICSLVAFVNGSTFIIDWHNYGYSILSLSLGNNHILVKIAKWYEEFFGQLSNGNLCVTKALKSDLYKNWQIKARVMHDKPGPTMGTIMDNEKHDLFKRLSCQYSCFRSGDGDTQFTEMCQDGNVVMKPQRPALLISSTSWTEDEDFSILIEALETYEEKKKDGHDYLPNIVCAVTGKGPLKTYYQEIIDSKCWKHVEIITPWLEAADYPKLLASSDLGVCLHTSSSGLDLPMKVVDMFGCCLPVLAINFSCLNELVIHNKNGLVFDNATQLSEQIITMLSDFPQCTLLNNLRLNVKDFQKHTWYQAWDENVLPLFKAR